MLMTPDEIVRRLSGSGLDIQTVSYREGRETHQSWKLVPDSSIVCSTSLPDCNRFELVSPILKAGQGLSQTSSVLSKLRHQVDLKVNKSMGFHVHIDVSQYSHPQLIKICQQFVKYEAAMDLLVPPSRRTNSPESNRYFRSSRDAIKTSIGTRSMGEVFKAIGRCRNIQELAALMNPAGRYYKLNLTNLANGRQPTLEFRQHSSTTSYDKVGSWVRFCFWFCRRSATLVAPKAFRSDRSLEYQLSALFTFVIKDRALHEFYHERYETLAGNHGEDDDETCACEECAYSRRRPKNRRL